MVDPEDTRRLDGAAFVHTRRLLLAGALAALCATTACSEPAAPGEPPVRVFAAASLIDALSEVGAAYAAHGHAAPIFNFAASSTLARQIEQGADADIVISADEAWMDYLAERALIETDSRTPLLANRLVLIAPADRPISLVIAPGFPLREALAGGRLAMADPESVPAGRYGRAALDSLGVWSAVADSIARAEDVRAALRLVENGEAAAGIVYLTDARAAGDRVRIVGEFPSDSHPVISYPVAIVHGRRGEAAAAFYAFLSSAESQEIFQRHGFEPGRR